MKPLFQNKTTLSKNIYIELLAFQQKKFGWRYTAYTAIFSLLFILLISLLFANHYFIHGFIFFVIFVCFSAYQFIQPTHKNTKEFHSDKVQNNLVNTYSFYENYFVIKNTMGSDKIFYHKLYRVFETKNYFYLYLDKTNILVLDKSGFLLGATQGFKEFIKHKMWLKFKEF
ncbi:MAG: YcxB family protein [Clostridia bacterium]|nr:YcxB family protein [Clostridia bacterium]